MAIVLFSTSVSAFIVYDKPYDYGYSSGTTKNYGGLSSFKDANDGDIIKFTCWAVSLFLDTDFYFMEWSEQTSGNSVKIRFRLTGPADEITVSVFYYGQQYANPVEVPASGNWDDVSIPIDSEKSVRIIRIHVVALAIYSLYIDRINVAYKFNF